MRSFAIIILMITVFLSSESRAERLRLMSVVQQECSKDVIEGTGSLVYTRTYEKKRCDSAECLTEAKQMSAASYCVELKARSLIQHSSLLDKLGISIERAKSDNAELTKIRRYMMACAMYCLDYVEKWDPSVFETYSHKYNAARNEIQSVVDGNEK